MDGVMTLTSTVRQRNVLVVGMALAGLSAGLWGLLAAEPLSEDAMRKVGRSEMKDGHFANALKRYRKLLSDPQSKGDVDQDLRDAVGCLYQLGLGHEAGELIESTVAVHAQRWPVLVAAADLYLSADHFGQLVGGVFQRGGNTGQGDPVNAHSRDRVRALQLFQQALPLLQKEPASQAVGQAYRRFAQAFQPENGESWRWQRLTDLSTLPDYEPGYPWQYHRRGSHGQQGAPVDIEGRPVFYGVPQSYEAAVNDGERARWLSLAAIEAHPALRDEIDWERCLFLHNEFGVQTLRGWLPANTGDEPQTGPLALETLTDDESIVRLATGVQRLTLPDEHNPLKLCADLAQRPGSQIARHAADLLASMFEDRRQFKKAAAAWKSALDRFGDEDHRRDRWQQVVGNWIQFQPVQGRAAGDPASLQLRFRNTQQVSFKAQAVRVPQLLDDVKAYLKGDPKELAWEKLDVSQLGYRLVNNNEKKYLGNTVAEWKLDVTPAPGHQDRVITVQAPLKTAGAYLITAQAADGNTSRVVLWLSDMAIIRKPLANTNWYFVADAMTGEPVSKANVEFFGWRHENNRPGSTRWHVATKNFAEFTTADGQLQLDQERLPVDYNWLVMARTETGRFAHLGFEGVWYAGYDRQLLDQTKVFTITDRPVYRPGQKVQFKFWIQRTKYDQAETVAFPDTEFPVVIQDPQGEKVFETTLKTDRFGGFSGEWPLADRAKLGVYQVYITNHGGGSFRVEEYKKPEFEVKIEAPDKPVKLGDRISAKVRANYYFGGAVTQGTVKYKVERTSHTAEWYPPRPWDWFYGPGYWWFASDYLWYPEFSRWGCHRPIPPWMTGSSGPPELVAEREVPIGADGTVSIDIDTMPARELHGDLDHRYQITAEVVDESRRTIVGQGAVLVAREPFRVHTWVDRGHYQTGDTMQVSVAAHTLDHQPVPGKGTLTLYRVHYNEDQTPVETEVQSWELSTGEDGQAQQQIAASRAGQYRLSYKLTSADGQTQEGGYLFLVRGDGFDGREFRFNNLEILADKAEYQPGDTVRLVINTDRTDSTVALFVRPLNGVYLPPQIIRLKGKSTTVEVPVALSDMPNFFVEALTVSHGESHTEVRELVVPPADRVIQVAVEPSQTEYQPGAPATVKVTLKDGDGRPFVGSTVLSVYDRSLDYIAGPHAIPEIREFFWKWRHHHQPTTMSSLMRWSTEVLLPGEKALALLGVFGDLLPDDFARNASGAVGGGMGGGGFGGGGEKRKLMRSMVREELAAASAPLPAPAMAAEMDSSDAAFEQADATGAVGGDRSLVEPTVRSQFADTAFWAAALTTDADGVAHVSFNMPENLTAWKMKAWALGLGTRVGEQAIDVVTRKNLLVRLQAPRFFVETDEVVLSANIHNSLPHAKQVQAVLELEGGCLEPLSPATSTVEIAAGGEQRVDWKVKVLREGTAIVRMKALSDTESDAMQQSFPVRVHGMSKQESFAGALRPEQEIGTVTFTTPAERRVNDSLVVAQFSPTLAGAMVDALPYLVDYPYGCTEQTLNRFLPTVITQRILQRMQLDLDVIREKRTNLNAQQLGNAQERAQRDWKKPGRNPVFDSAEVENMVRDGLERLTSMQLSDGGWGWFSGWGERSSAHTTAVVVHGLQIAQQNDVALVPGMLDRGLNWLKNYQTEQVAQLQRAPKAGEKPPREPYRTSADALDAFVFAVLVDAGMTSPEMLEFLYRDRLQLPATAQALFGLALQKQQPQHPEKLAMLLENLRQFLVQDDSNQTAYLRLPNDAVWWSWYGNSLEANANYLKLLCRVNPQDPVASRLVKYLLNNRRYGYYWASTRETANCIEALAEYLVASGEDRPDMTVEVWLDGHKLHEVHITAENLFNFENSVRIQGDAVTDGLHNLEFRKRGKGPLYYNVYATNFTLENFITKAGLEVQVERQYYRLVRVEDSTDVAGSRGQALQQAVEKYTREPLANLAGLTSGELVEVELLVTSKNDYEYLIFADQKAAGFEPVELRSGYHAQGMRAYVEYRDEETCFFVRELPRGQHSVRYQLRAEVPGQFSALPTRAEAMYAPELKANSDEIKLRIDDRPKLAAAP
jgi:alpha-2-macroglobulin